MFGSRKNKTVNNTSNPSFTENQTGTNLIGQGTKIEGELVSEGTIRIEGEINGYLESKSRIIIGKTGIVKGDIVCESIDISGQVVGTLQVKDILFLKETGIVDGEISTQKLVVETGAVFNGNCRTKIGNAPSSEKLLEVDNYQKAAV